MPVNFDQALSLLVSMVALTQIGILFSGSGYLSNLIIKYTKRGDPDPTKWFRIWTKGYDRFISPFAGIFVSEEYSSNRNQLLYHFGVSVAVILFAPTAYIIFSGTVIGTMLASYYTMGFAPDLSNLIQTGAATILLIAIAVIFDSTERTVDQNI